MRYKSSSPCAQRAQLVRSEIWALHDATPSMPKPVVNALPTATQVRSHLDADAHRRSYRKTFGLFAILGVTA